MTQVLCSNLINSLPVDKHCPSRNTTENTEKEFTFEYNGRRFRSLKPAHQCEACATTIAKRWFDNFAAKLLFERDGKLCVRWTYLKKLRQQRKSDRARGIPQLDEEYQALQLLHDLGFLTMDESAGWGVQNPHSSGDDFHLTPSWYKLHKLYFVDLRDAFAYAKACLKGYNLEVRKGYLFYTSATIFGA